MAVIPKLKSKLVLSPNKKIQKKKESDVPVSSPSKAMKSPGVQTENSDSEDNRRTCHQCRQKGSGLRAVCKNMKKHKPCPINFCKTCLLNRYGEKVEEVDMFSDWKCPRCRSICNCSVCMKRNGNKPTGQLVHSAKKTGFMSVSDMLIAKGATRLDSVKVAKEVDTSPENLKVPIAASPCKSGKENLFSGTLDSKQPKVISNTDAKNVGKRKQKNERKTDSNVSDKNKGDAMKPKKSSKRSKTSEKLPNALFNEKANDSNGAILDVEISKTSQLVEAIAPNIIKGEEEKSEKNDHFVEKKKKKSNKDDNPVKKGEKQPNIIKEEEGKKKKKKSSKDDNPMKKGGKQVQSNGACLLDKTVLQVKVSEEVLLKCSKKEENLVEKNASLSNNEKEVCGSGNEGKDQVKTKSEPSLTFGKRKKNATGICNTDSEANIQLPQCTDLTNVAGIDFPAEDVGHALQFLEFCRAFGQVFDLKKGQPEAVLRELMRGSGRRRGQYSSIVIFYIQLLSFLRKDSGEESHLSSPTSSGDSWLQALGECLSNSQFAFKDLPSNCFDRGGDGYYKLDTSKRLRLLNFLCDETLGTAAMRSWIDEQNSRIIETEKKAREKVLAAKEKEKSVKQQMQDEIARATLLKDGAPLSITEHDNLVSKMKAETANAHEEMLQAMEMLPKKKQLSDAIRTESVHVEETGHIFWRLNSLSGANILVQGVGSLDSAVPEEKWSTYDVEQTNVVEKYISLRRKRVRTPRATEPVAHESTETSIKHEVSVEQSSPMMTDGERS